MGSILPRQGLEKRSWLKIGADVQLRAAMLYPQHWTGKGILAVKR